ncbi:hypothetical protein [Sodaliphilus sp.]|uniref:hypothetical protein n=1 Tax=Sodaliphilus sp. TaxID=2815818 RepID=UPI00388E0BAB
MKKLILFLLLVMGLQMHAQTEYNGFYLEEHENSKLLYAAYSYKVLDNDMTAVMIEVKVHTTGWNLGDWDQPGGMLKLRRLYGDQMTYMEPNDLNTDGDDRTYYLVEQDGPNGAYHSFCDIWETTDDMETIKNTLTKYYVVGTNKGQKEHSCTIVVGWHGGVPTGVNDLQVQAVDVDETVYDLMGRKVTAPVSGSIYIKNHKKFIQR